MLPFAARTAAASVRDLNPDQDSMYVHVTPSQNDGTGVYRLTVRDVPVDGFWSISVCDAEGCCDARTLHSITAQKDADGAVTVQFGGNGRKGPNHLPIFPGWSYMVRLYRPQPDVLDGSWFFPEATRVRRIPWERKPGRL